MFGFIRLLVRIFKTAGSCVDAGLMFCRLDVELTGKLDFEKRRVFAKVVNHYRLLPIWMGI